eukprot:gene9665-biopygen7702
MVFKIKYFFPWLGGGGEDEDEDEDDVDVDDDDDVDYYYYYYGDEEDEDDDDEEDEDDDDEEEEEEDDDEEEEVEEALSSIYSFYSNVEGITWKYVLCAKVDFWPTSASRGRHLAGGGKDGPIANSALARVLGSEWRKRIPAHKAIIRQMHGGPGLAGPPGRQNRPFGRQKPVFRPVGTPSGTDMAPWWYHQKFRNSEILVVLMSAGPPQASLSITIYMVACADLSLSAPCICLMIALWADIRSLHSEPKTRAGAELAIGQRPREADVGQKTHFFFRKAHLFIAARHRDPAREFQLPSPPPREPNA